MEPQKPSGLAPIPAHSLEDPTNDLPLELLTGLFEGQGLGLPMPTPWVRQHQVDGEVRQSDEGAIDQPHCALHDVLELAHVPGPRVFPETRQGVR